MLSARKTAWLLVVAGAGATGCAPEREREVGVCLGSLYSTSAVIDPDAPEYRDAGHTQAEVTRLFAEAEAQGSDAYRAYRAARDHAGALECAFCSCGCADSIGHRSAVDCFKDMHGFNCVACQSIALRAEALAAQGLDEQALEDQLTREYP